MLNAVGVAKKAYKYDDKGRLSEIRHFGTDGSLRERTLEKIDMDSMIGGIGAGAITKYKYEGERKLPSEIAFYGKDEQPVGVQALDNAASVKLKYGDQGNIAEVSAFGTDGLPRAINKDVFGKDVVTIKFSIDEFGNTIQKALYNKDGNLVAAKNEKFAIAKFKYNNKRQKIEESAFGTSEEPVEITNEGNTFHKKTMEYDDDGKITKTTYYDKNDKETKSDNYINEAFEWVAKPSVRDGRIVGTVKNISNQSRSAEISFVLYNANGNQMGTKSDWIKNLQAGNTWNFNVFINNPRVTDYGFAGIKY